jgi:hypothetical protein
MKSVDQIDRLLAAVEAYVIAVIREAINVPLVAEPTSYRRTKPASYRQETVEARARLIAAIGEFDQG